MEKREGYKNTKIGWIPEHWDVSNLGRLVKISSGQSPSKFDFSPDGEYKFFKVNQLNFCSKYLKDSEYSYDSNGYNNFPKGMVVFPKRGASIFTNKVRILGNDGFFDTNLMGLKSKTNLDNEFLYYFLIMFKLANIADTSSVPQINNKHISPISISLPPLPEQKRIASILSTVDDKISSIEHQIQQTEQLKKGLMEKLLTEGIGHTEFKETKIGRIPKGWNVSELSSYCEKICVGFVGTCEKYYTDETSGILMLRTGNLQGGKLRLTNLKYVSNDFHNKNVKSQIQPEDLIIARHGSSGQAVLIPEDFSEANCLNIVIVRPDKGEYIPLYLAYLFNSSIIQKQIQQKTAGSTQGVVNTKEISNTIFLQPPLEEQKQIATILSTVDDKIEVLNQKKTHYQTLKKGLSQQLLTGQMRVKV